MSETQADAMWTNGYENAIYEVLAMIRKEFPNPTFGIKKAICLIEAMGYRE